RVRARGALGGAAGGVLQGNGRTAAIPHVAAPPSLRADWLERAEGDLAVRHRRDHLRAVQPGDVEAAVTVAVDGWGGGVGWGSVGGWVGGRGDGQAGDRRGCGTKRPRRRGAARAPWRGRHALGCAYRGAGRGVAARAWHRPGTGRAPGADVHRRRPRGAEPRR